MDFVDKIKEAAGQPEQIDQAIEQAGDFIDSKTGGQYAAQVDQAQDFAKEQAAKFLGGDSSN